MTGSPRQLFIKKLGMAMVALATMAIAPAIQSQTVAYTGSLQFATGNYFFNQRTTGLSLLSGFSLSLSGLRLSANIPLIYQNTPYVSYSGIGILPSGGSESSLVRGRQGKREVILPEVEVIEYDQIGFGDPLLHADLELWREGKVIPSLRIVAETKVPLAKPDQGFGTSRWDFSGGLSLTKTLGRTFLFVDLAYWVLGDLPDLELKDTVSYSIALGFPLSGGKYALMASFSGQSAIIADAEPPKLIGLGFSYRMSSKTSLMLNASLGLTESSPDFILSTGWRVGF